ncbi:MAG: bifunctional 4-hydroxy-2-oxoglutarate aldolase/2-dehydro-3-deoxy-phosphogluconate aldolase [Clostridium sp.]|nr:bifunctional 4-hydroxy-2-oxoglutarate aldolase/2-dehydro-3-deoxy-phosphogluconate aldolase [Clostridium sp.]
MDTLEQILKEKIVVIIRGLSKEESVEVVGAVKKGGLKLVEVTYDQTKPISYTTEKIKAIADAFNQEEVLVGAGTVLTPEQVDSAEKAGAKFIITPNTNEAVIKETKRLGLASMCGAMTPTEIEACYQYGSDIVKVFPADNLGITYMKAIRGPLNHIPLAAVGGVNLDNIEDFLAIGIHCFGIGGNIVNQKLVKAGKLSEITELAKKYYDKVHSFGA